MTTVTTGVNVARAMSYRPSSKPLETAWARHLDQVRKDHDWSATQLFKDARETLNLGPESRSTFVAELHHDPKPHWIAGLTALYGAPPDTEPEPPPAPEEPSEQAQLIAAIGDLVRQVEQERAATGSVTATPYVGRVPDRPDADTRG